MKARNIERRSRKKVIAVKPNNVQVTMADINNVRVTKRTASNQTSFLFCDSEKVTIDVCYAAFFFSIFE